MPLPVALRWSGPLERARIGVITGRAELIAADSGVAAAVALVDAVLDDGVPDDGTNPETARPGDAGRIAAPDRDRVLAAVYVALYGASVQTTLTCGSCAQPFDLDFSVPKVVAHCEPDPASGDPAAWRWSDVELRVPTGDDEIAALAAPDPAGALLDAVSAGAARSDDDRAEIARQLETLAPMVSAPIGAVCPECDDEQAVTFDIQRYLLDRLVMDRPRVLADVHVIASTYGWSRSEILGLERSERRAYVAMISDSGRIAVRERIG
jgi:hypothetical protein